MIQTVTTARIVCQTIYVRLPTEIIRSPSYTPTNKYHIEIDAQGTITLTPFTLTSSLNENGEGKDQHGRN